MTSAILAFGDSLTWGRNPDSRERYAREDRWPTVLQAALGEDVCVVAEGLPGRTTIFDDPGSLVDKNGAKCLPILLATHEPLSLVILMFGSNDLKPAICGSVAGVVAGLAQLVGIVRNFSYQTQDLPPDVLIVSPPHFCMTASGDGPRGARSVAESQRLAPALKLLCERTGCLFLDAAEFARPSPVDGVHLDRANTRAVGNAVAQLLNDRPGLRSQLNNQSHPTVEKVELQS